MKKCSCRESNSRLLIEITASYPLYNQDNDAGKCNFLAIRKCNFLVIIFKERSNSIVNT